MTAAIAPAHRSRPNSRAVSVPAIAQTRSAARVIAASLWTPPMVMRD
jgi:hypothetical protein